MERDKDVVAQAQAIEVLEALPQLSFSVVNALNSFLSDSKVISTLLHHFCIYFVCPYLCALNCLSIFVFQAFWRVRIQAAYALAATTSEVYSMLLPFREPFYLWNIR